MTYFAVLFHAHTDWICDTLIMNCSHFLFLMYVLALVKCKECLFHHITHSHGSATVLEGRRSEWMGKPEISPRPNTLTDRHQKLRTWLCPGYLPTSNI